MFLPQFETAGKQLATPFSSFSSFGFFPLFCLFCFACRSAFFQFAAGPCCLFTVICRESSCVCAGLGSMTKGCCQGEDRSGAPMSSRLGSKKVRNSRCQNWQMPPYFPSLAFFPFLSFLFLHVDVLFSSSFARHGNGPGCK